MSVYLDLLVEDTNNSIGRYSLEIYEYKDANKKIQSGIGVHSATISNTQWYSDDVFGNKEPNPKFDLTSTDGGKTYSGTYLTYIKGEDVTCVMKLKKNE